MRRVRSEWLVLGCLALLAPSRARAQEQAQLAPPGEETGFAGPIVWNFGGQINVPLADSSRINDVGGGFAVGVTYSPIPLAGLQLEYGVDWAGLKTGPLSTVGIFGHSNFQYFNLNVVVHALNTGGVGLYLVGGGGLYYRSVTVSRTTGTAVVPYCDPWLLYCAATPVSTSAIVGSRHSWDWGVDGGLGFTFAVAPPVRLYVEARYHYIFGPSFNTPTGKKSANGQFLPITLGVRF